MTSPMTLPITLPGAADASRASGAPIDAAASPTGVSTGRAAGVAATPAVATAKRISPSGLVASVLASMAFASVFGLPGMLEGIDAFGAFGWRIISALPFIAVILTMLRQWGALADILRRVVRRPALALVIVANGLLIGVQMVLFAWAPMHGEALAASFGYFVLPLAIVAVGVVFLRERLSRMRVVAIVFAAVGVVVAIAAGASVSWATLVVVVGYPGYFLLRRRFGLDSPAALALEMLVLAPISLVFVLQPANLAGLTGSADNLLPVLGLGVLTAIGFSAYTIAQQRLSFSLFGLLGYLEPLLLVVVSVVLLGESLGVADLASYAAIVVAMAALAADGLPGRIVARRADRRSRPVTRPRRRGASAGARAGRSTPSRARRSASATSRSR